MSESDLQKGELASCPKHKQPSVYICSIDTCKQNRLICEICKQKQTLHFSHHANYIYRIKQFKEFQNSKSTISRLEKGIFDCQNYIKTYKKTYLEQIQFIKNDFVLLKNQFVNMADKYQKIYIAAFEKEMLKYDEKIHELKQTLREHTKQKNHQDSLFTMLFHEKKQQNLENLIVKNSKAFKVRAEIITLRSTMAMDKNNNSKYKGTQIQQKKFNELQEYLIEFSMNYFDRFRTLFNNLGDSQNLRNSIASQTKSLGMSRLSMGSALNFNGNLSQSQVSQNSERGFERVQMPSPHPQVIDLRAKLPNIMAPKNVVLEGPFLYSTGVYLGQMQNQRRNGFGTFIFSDGSLYEGGWQNDIMSGYGRLIKKICYYEGEVKNGKAHGKGNYEDQYRTYSGQWKDDKRSGIGQQQFKTKHKKYVGMFQNDKYNGKGKLIDQQHTYDGKFRDGQFHGQCIINFKNRQTFRGTFHEGSKNFGRHTYPDGSYYDGMFKQNTPNGTGQFYWADGLKYSGQWKNGCQDGVGVQIHQDGKQMRGLWKNGKWEKWL